MKLLLMKTLLFTLFLFFTGFTFAQKIDLRDNNFYVNDSLVYKHQIKNVLMANPTALNMYNKAKKRQTFGGLILATGISLIVADGVMGLTTENRAYPKVLTLAGVVVAGVSIPVLLGNKERVKKSIDLYNESQPDTPKTLGYNYNLNIITNTNGLGLAITF